MADDDREARVGYSRVTSRRGAAMMHDLEVRFTEGNVTQPVRVGDTVRREAGPHTPAVHALLGHLERRGYAGSPRVLGFDAREREVLTFMPGETLPTPTDHPPGDAALVAVARLLREMHDATLDFVPPTGARWWHMPGAPATGDVVCHNDVAPWNTVAAEGRPLAFIDWDFAEPGPRSWDIAYAAWCFVPLTIRSFAEPLPEKARRVRLFFDAYDCAIAPNFLDLLERRIYSAYELKRDEAAKGQPGFAAMWAADRGRNILADLAWVQREHQTLRGLLKS